MNAPKKVAIAIKSIEFTKNGELVIVAQPNELNPKGSYVMNVAQEQRLLQRCGVPTVDALKHLIALSNGTSKLTYDHTFMKAGEAWDNGKTGADRRSGIVGEKSDGKDWNQTNNHEITLGFAAQMKVTEIALNAAFAGGNSIRSIGRPVAVSRPQPILVGNEGDFMGDSSGTGGDNPEV